MAKQDYYDTLGVARSDDAETVKKAYRKLAMKYHPDRNQGDTAAEHKFKEISEAYDVLKDDQKRAAYDRFGHAAFENGGPGAGGRTGGFDFGSGFADIFDEMFGDFAGGRRGGAGGGGRGSDLRYNMEIPLEQALSRPRDQDQDPGLGELRNLPRLGRRAGQPAGPVRHVPGPRQGARATGLLHHRADLPDLRRHGPGDRGSVQAMRRLGPRAGARRRWRSPSRGASRTAPASGSPARARPGSTAPRPATSTSSSASPRTRCSSATG